MRIKNASVLWIIFCAVLVNSQGYAQQDVLPRGLSQEEKALLKDYVTPVPEGNLSWAQVAGDGDFRAMAEWEELQAVVITWTSFPAILAEIVRSVRKECEVIIVCANQGSVQNYLTNKGIDWSTNVTFVQGPFNSIWVRDYGPNTVYRHDVDSLFLVDWIYNRPRPKDDVLPSLIGSVLQIPVIGTTTAPEDLVHTGGNFMSDGMGTGFSSELVLEENGPNNNYGFSNHSEAEVDEIMFNTMGIEPYVKMTNLPYDLIHHIDMHMKLIDEETLIVGQYPNGIADGPQIEANLQYVLSNFNSRFGTPFRVIRIPMPPDGSGKFPNQGGDYWTYANALIANRTVIVPTYSPQYDTTALRIWQEAMPGYTVTGIDCQDIIPLSGALHCITKEVGVQDPLRIVHQRIDGTNATPDGYLIDALIQHQSGINQAYVYYTTDTTAGFAEVAMVPSAEADHFQGFIPVLSEGVDVFYYIAAEANSGKMQTRPLTAPSGFWTFSVPTSTSVDPDDQPGAEVQPVFPNPASAITCIPIELDRQEDRLTVDLVDPLGRMTNLFQGDAPAGMKRIFFDAGQYPAGVYQVRVSTARGRSTQSLLIQP